MKLRQFIMVSAAMAFLPFATNWKAVSSKAKINFSVKGPFGTVHGSFTGLKATIHFDEKDVSGSSLTASIETRTVSTGIKLRNRDLTHKEIWFNSEKYPRISFQSKKIEKTANGFKASGSLTIKATTKEVIIPFTFSGKGNAALFKGQFHINREDFGVGKKGGSVGNDITIQLEVPVTKS